ncbi:hypothetical protein OQL36_003025 [Clostridium perfringens]
MENKIKELKMKINLYKEFLKYEYNELLDLFKKAKTTEEQDFYIVLANLKLQREQKKVIKQGF